MLFLLLVAGLEDAQDVAFVLGGKFSDGPIGGIVLRQFNDIFA